MTRTSIPALAALVVVVSTGGLAARAPQPAAPAPFDSGKAYEHLRQMVAIGPRPAGSAALRQTRAYITAQLASYGLTVKEQPFTADTPMGPIAMDNLIVDLPGRRPDRILLTGHYDTKRAPNFVFVGASDAASSAAILIELARVLKGRSHEFTYELVWFDGEEATCWDWDQCGKPGHPDNLYGSRYYVEAARKANTLQSVKAMILFDMIGARDLKLRRENQYSAKWLNDIFWATAKRTGHDDTFLNADLPVDDDHLPFSEAGVATIDLIDLQDYPEWHTAQDDLAHVAAGSLQIVGDVTLAALPEIEKHLSQ
jgi:glutaminyl-peptide cyclotransferase